MSQTSAQRKPNEVYCRDCGKSIKAEAEICPQCGVRQSPPPTDSANSYSFIFAFVDAWKRQNALRHLTNIVLLFVSVGTYAGLMLMEAFIHYRNLNAGDVEPFSGDKNQRVWVIPLNPEQYQSETTSDRPAATTSPEQSGSNNREQRAGSTQWLDEFDEAENRIQIENRSNDTIAPTVGVRTTDEATVVGSVELQPGSSEEWNEFPIDDQIEVGVILDGEKVTDQFGSRGDSFYEIEITVAEEGIEFTNVAKTSFAGKRGDTSRTAGAGHSTPETPPDRFSQSRAAERASLDEAEKEMGHLGGGKILLLGLAIMFVVGPAISVFAPVPGFVNSIVWAAGALTILFGLYRIISARWL